MPPLQRRITSRQSNPQDAGLDNPDCLCLPRACRDRGFHIDAEADEDLSFRGRRGALHIPVGSRVQTRIPPLKPSQEGVSRRSRHSPDRDRHPLDLIDLLTDLNRYAESINYYDMLIRLAPEETDLLLSKGIAQVNAGLYTQAIETFDEVIAAKPQDPLPVFRKGMVLLRLKRMDDAMRCYLKSLELDPSYGNNWLKAGVYATTFMDQDLLKGPAASETSESSAPAAKSRRKAKKAAESENFEDEDADYADDADDVGVREETRRRSKSEAGSKAAADADAYETAEPKHQPSPMAQFLCSLILREDMTACPDAIARRSFSASIPSDNAALYTVSGMPRLHSPMRVCMIIV